MVFLRVRERGFGSWVERTEKGEIFEFLGGDERSDSLG